MVLAKEGDLQKGGRDAATLFNQTYYNDYVAHAAIEPHTAVVNVEGGKATVWASTQTPFRAKDEVAQELGIPSKNVRVMPVFLGGGFGGKSMNRQIVEAARCAKLSKKPVQVAWTRKEEFYYDSFRPAAVIEIKSGMTRRGKISMWDYHVYFAGERGANQFYSIPNHRTTVYSSSPVGIPGAHPFATGPWRAPANNTSTFARESQIDIMAAKAEMDPLEFRIQNLTDQKMHRVLNAAAKQFGWTPSKAPSGKGIGVACCIDAGTYVATMAKVGVEKTTGRIHVERVVTVQDMGLVINPEGAAIQMEGGVTMGLGYALRERIRFKGGEIFDLNFGTYQIPSFSWLPRIETVIIADDNTAPQGGGEPAIVTIGAVVANALYDAIGVRLFQLPLTPDRIIDALKS
jgi:isoquinoline 1-oxidoreductase